MRGIIKALIYIGGIVAGFFAIMAGMIIMDVIMPGFRPGYMINFVIIWFFWFNLPKRLCAKLDVKAFEKAAAEKRMTPGEYASTYFAPSLLELCESNKNDKTSFERLMKQCIEGEAISKSDANVLRYMFRKGK